jgi:hypothetical protein
MTIEIRDFDHARALVNAGDVTAADVGDSHSACLLHDAFSARLDELGDCRSESAIDEGKFICDQLDALDCDWMDEPAPECQSHLY